MVPYGMEEINVSAGHISVKHSAAPEADESCFGGREREERMEIPE
jgi:hypothetical protein